jgi:hypothetical protein
MVPRQWFADQWRQYAALCGCAAAGRGGNAVRKIRGGLELLKFYVPRTAMYLRTLTASPGSPEISGEIK